MMVYIVRLQHHARKLRKQIGFLIRGPRRADHTDPRPASRSRISAKFFPISATLLPSGRSEFAILPNQRLRQPFFMIRKIESVASLNTKKVTVRPALVAVIAAHNLHSCIGATHAQRGLAPIPQWVQVVPTCFISHGRVL